MFSKQLSQWGEEMENLQIFQTQINSQNLANNFFLIFFFLLLSPPRFPWKVSRDLPIYLTRPNLLLLTHEDHLSASLIANILLLWQIKEGKGKTNIFQKAILIRVLKTTLDISIVPSFYGQKYLVQRNQVDSWRLYTLSYWQSMNPNSGLSDARVHASFQEADLTFANAEHLFAYVFNFCLI